MLLRAPIIVVKIAAAVVISGAAGQNLLAEIHGGDAIRLAKSFEGGKELSRAFLTAANSSSEGDSPSCIDDLSRAATTLRLVDFDLSTTSSTPDAGAPATAALAAVDRRLACVPTDGNAWFWRARLLVVTGAGQSAMETALGNSYRLAPAEKWIMEPRWAFASALYPTLSPTLQVLFTIDQRRLIDFESVDWIAKSYVAADAGIRSRMVDQMRQQTDDRQKKIAELTDSLGLTFITSEGCTTIDWTGLGSSPSKTNPTAGKPGDCIR